MFHSKTSKKKDLYACIILHKVYMIYKVTELDLH